MGTLRRRAAFAATLVALAWGEGDARASPSAKLVYVRSSGAESCPATAELRAAVARRLGYDPFFAIAEKTVVVQVNRAADGYRAHVHIVGDDGALRGERDLASSGDDCVELVGAIALAVSLALDDLEDRPAAAPPSDAPSVVASPEAAPAPREDLPPSRDDRPPPPPPARARASEPLRLTLSAGPSVTLATAPSPAMAVAFAGSLHWRRFSLRFDGRADLPAGTDFAGGGRVATNAAIGAVSGCLRGETVFGCLGAGGGAIYSRTSAIAAPASDRGPLVFAVTRIGIDLALGAQFYLEPALEAGLHLLGYRVVVDREAVYEMPLLWAAASVQVGRFF